MQPIKPIVTITTRQNKSAEFKNKVLTAAHTELIHASVNPNDVFHRVLELSADDFRFDPTFPDVKTRRTEEFILMEILLDSGAALRSKNRLLQI